MQSWLSLVEFSYLDIWDNNIICSYLHLYGAMYICSQKPNLAFTYLDHSYIVINLLAHYVNKFLVILQYQTINPQY